MSITSLPDETEPKVVTAFFGMRFPVVLVLVALLAQLSVYDGIERKKDTVGVEEDIYAWGFNEYGQLVRGRIL